MSTTTKPIQTNTTVNQLIAAIRQHRFFDGDEYREHDVVGSEQYRTDLDRATLTIQILLHTVGTDLDATQLREILLSAGFYPSMVDDVLCDYPYIY